MEETTAKQILEQLIRIADALEYANSISEKSNKRAIKKSLEESRKRRNK